jgi:DNA-directed RNA polymerase subunit RPC12/RpoP
MRPINVSTRTIDDAFEYYCPICGIELSRSNYEASDEDYFCPYCSTRRHASRVTARPR